MTIASTTAAAALIPRPRLWGIGRYYAGAVPVDFEIGWEDWRRDTRWARALLADHGIGPASGLVIVGGMPESPWFDPVETAARELGAPYSIGDVYPFEAFRTGMYARRLPITMIFGINRAIAEGLGDELADVVERVPVIVARPEAHPALEAAGARPFTVTRIGPALAVECPHRAGAHVNDAEWTVAESGGDLFISSAGPRAHRVSRAALCIHGTVSAGPCRCGRTGQRVTVGPSQGA
jgi:hypothetical protein